VAAGTPGIAVSDSPVDARDVPEPLAGFRTIFLALHHFTPVDAGAILASAVRAGEGIAVVEGASRSPAGLAAMAAAPLAVLFDGVVSVLRIYTPEEMLAMSAGAPGAEAYDWTTGLMEVTGAPVGWPYLIGVPRRSTAAAPSR
jgi:hypothetical protein